MRNLFRFFKRGEQNIKKQGLDSTIEPEERVTTENQEASISPKLSLHPDWQATEEDRYVYQFLNNSCAPLKPNQVSLSGANLAKDENGNAVVTALVRTSLSTPLTLDVMKLVLMDSEKNIIAKKSFNFKELGEIPPASSRPWQFIFEKENLKTKDLPKENWTLAFQVAPPHKLDLDETWENNLSENEKESLKNLVEKEMTPPKDGEVNFQSLQADQAKNGNLHISLLLRNGTDQDVTFEQIPLIVEDAMGDQIAEGVFQTKDLLIKAYTTKPWTFIFPASLIQKENADFRRWRAYPNQL